MFWKIAEIFRQVTATARISITQAPCRARPVPFPYAWGVGDIDLGLRYKLLENKLGIFSAQGLVKVPEAYDEDDDLPLGNGQYDLEAKLLYGRSLWPVIPGYTNLEIGYRWRDQEPSDEIRYWLSSAST